MTDALDLLRDEADARAQALPLPGSAEVWRSGTRRRRRARVLSATGVLVVLGALVGAVLVLPPEAPDVQVSAPPPSARVSATALGEAVRRAVPEWSLRAATEDEQSRALGPWEAPGRARASTSVTAELRTPDRQGAAELSVDWVRVTPAVTDTEADRIAASDSGRPLGPVQAAGGVATRAWTTDTGFVTVWGWSAGGYVAALRGGGGPVDTAVLADRAAALLRDLLGGPRLAPDTAARDEAARLVDDLSTFARDPRPELLAALPLASRVVLAVGPSGPRTERSPAELAEPAAWDVALPSEGYSGLTDVPSALALLRRDGGHVVQVGPHQHCAAAARPAPAGLEGALRYSAQPAEPASCQDWWTVDLFVRDGVVVGVSVDFWEP